MHDWILFNNWQRVENGLRERIEQTNSPSKLLFLLSALMDARESRVWGNHANNRDTGTETI